MSDTPADARTYDKVIKLTKKEPDEVKLDIDWASVEADERAPRQGRGRPARGERMRDRGGRRDAAPKALAPGEADRPVVEHPAVMTDASPDGRLDASAQLTELSLEGPPQREALRSVSRTRRASGVESARGRTRHEREAQAVPPRDEARERGAPAVVGFGADVPAFLRVAPPRRDAVALED